MPARFDPDQLTGFVAALFENHGVPGAQAKVLARGFLEADLLGFDTHGLARVPANLEWLEQGLTRSDVAPLVISERAAVACWDAGCLPGPWVMHLAVQHAMSRAVATGSFTLTLRHCQHIACLAAALVPVVETGLVGLVMASSPDETYVSPFGGSGRLFSNNPIAFAAPTSREPLLFDISMAITAGGRVARAQKEGVRLSEAALKSTGGQVSDDPEVFAAGGTVMPIGGTGHGHKGHALTLMTEALTQALSGHGRADSSGDSEENSVFLQVLDPEAFGPREDYLRQMDHLVGIVAASPADRVDEPVRVPGQGAWRKRTRQLRDGVILYPGVFESLLPWAEADGIRPPTPL
ncbi:MAG: Ldh family oxidoreductase [Pseudomonadales bacterium]